MVSRRYLSVSVIIPACGRINKLENTIKSILNQTYLPFEIFVIDDSEDNSVLNMCEKFKQNITYIKNKLKGQGNARNLGASNSRGDILLFIDSDIIASENLIKNHVYWHKKGEKVVLGKVNFPEIPIDYYNSIVDIGAYFEKIKENKLDFIKFITCNISINRQLFCKSGGFDPGFTTYGFEDIELGYRIGKNKKFIRYAPKAVGIHYNNRKLSEILERAETVARASLNFAKKHPEYCNKWLLPHQRIKSISLHEIPVKITPVNFQDTLRKIEENTVIETIISEVKIENFEIVKNFIEKNRIICNPFTIYELAWYSNWYNLNLRILPNNFITRHLVWTKQPYKGAKFNYSLNFGHPQNLLHYTFLVGSDRLICKL